MYKYWAYLALDNVLYVSNIKSYTFNIIFLL